MLEFYDKNGMPKKMNYIILIVALLTVGIVAITCPKSPAPDKDIGAIIHYEVYFKEPVIIMDGDKAVSMDRLAADKLFYTNGILAVEFGKPSQRLLVSFTNIKYIKTSIIVDQEKQL